MHEILAMSKKSIFYASSDVKTRNKTIRMQIISVSSEPLRSKKIKPKGSIWGHSSFVCLAFSEFKKWVPIQ